MLLLMNLGFDLKKPIVPSIRLLIQSKNSFHSTPSHCAGPSPVSSPLLIHPLLSPPIIPAIHSSTTGKILSMAPTVSTWSLQLKVTPQPPHCLLKSQILILHFSYQTLLLLNPMIFKRHASWQMVHCYPWRNALVRIKLGLLFLYFPIDMLSVVNGCLNLKNTLMALFLDIRHGYGLKVFINELV